MALRGHRRPRRYRRGVAPISSIDRSIEHASVKSLAMAAVPMILGGGVAVGSLMLLKSRSIGQGMVKNADGRNYIFAALGMGAGVAIHSRLPNVGIGLIIGSALYAVLTPVGKAVDSINKQIDAPPAAAQLPAGQTTTTTTTPATTMVTAPAT